MLMCSSRIRVDLSMIVREGEEEEEQEDEEEDSMVSEEEDSECSAKWLGCCILAVIEP